MVVVVILLSCTTDGIKEYSTIGYITSRRINVNQEFLSTESKGMSKWAYSVSCLGKRERKGIMTYRIIMKR